MAKKKEEVIETAEVKPTEIQKVEVTPEMLEQLGGGIVENFSYGLGEMLLMNDIENRIFYLDEEVTPDVFREITMFIIKANIQDAGVPIEERLPIKIVINSPGGSVLDGVGLIDAIRTSTTPVVGITSGYAYSMGFNIFCACAVRICFPMSSFLMHDGSTGLFDSSTKFRDTVKFYDKLDEKLDKMIASRSKLTMKELEDRKRTENFWFAEDAKELGIVDYIIGEDVSIEDVFCFKTECDCEECSCDS